MRLILLVAGLAFGLVLATPAIASAHTVAVGGTVVCADDHSHHVTWTVMQASAPSSSTATLTLSSPLGGLSATTVHTTGNGVSTVTQTVPGTTTGADTLSAQVLWSDGPKKSMTGTVTLGDPCPTPTTTTTTTTLASEVLGTNQTAPPTTTTSTAAASKTTSTPSGVSGAGLARTGRDVRPFALLAVVSIVAGVGLWRRFRTG
jgi:hypothetical protein